MKDIYHALPKNHFGDFMTRVLKELEAGESVCVYGMPGIGRRYFARQVGILLNEVKWADKIIYLEPARFEASLINVIKDQLSSLVKTKTKSLATTLREYLTNHRIVIILSYLERVKNKKGLLNFLIDLKTLHQTNVVLLVTADHSILSKPEEYFFRPEPLAESFYSLKPFDLFGVKRIISLLIEIYGWKIDSDLAGPIHRLGGGSPALTKYLCKTVDVFGRKILIKPETLMNYLPLKIRLEELMQLLLTEDLNHLKQIGLISDFGKPFCGLLSKYLKNFEIENLDIAFPNLSRLEKKILSFLILNKNKLVDKDRIAFWMEMTEEKYSLWAIYKIISRLKKKIGGRYRLETIKGRGYRLREVDTSDRR